MSPASAAFRARRPSAYDPFDDEGAYQRGDDDGAAQRSVSEVGPVPGEDATEDVPEDQSLHDREDNRRRKDPIPSNPPMMPVVLA